MSDVSVVVMDCTEMGASPPTFTEPTEICRDLRRGARVGGGSGTVPSDGMPMDTGDRLTVLFSRAGQELRVMGLTMSA
jgi:hypothetical protein